ncbi:hypothetical protein ACFQ3L_02090 [Lacticaseibacillus jixianensis]|uniref:Oxidoreductase n=1 Tax=Lacticaseibacillus jixianensis TaxID=2486012 RepID=A0ABW4B671_9LACO|nr:hypothetical protein [Lacticaseibacillus jixianensis]
MSHLTKLSDTKALNAALAIPALGVIVDEAPAPLAAAALAQGYRHLVCAPAHLATVQAAVAAAATPVFITVRLVSPVAPALAALAQADLLVATAAADGDLTALAQAVAAGRAKAWGSDAEDQAAAGQAVLVMPLGVTRQYPAAVARAQAAHQLVATDLPFGQGDLALLRPLRRMAERYQKTPAQIVVRWLLQGERLVWLPAQTPAQLAEWGDVFDFELSFHDMQVLASLDGRAMAPQKRRRH